jgi:hypothetical protein
VQVAVEVESSEPSPAPEAVPESEVEPVAAQTTPAAGAVAVAAAGREAVEVSKVTVSLVRTEVAVGFGLSMEGEGSRSDAVLDGGGVWVGAIKPGSPAAAAAAGGRLAVGMRVLQINGTDVAHSYLDAVVTMLTASSGDTLDMVLRPDRVAFEGLPTKLDAVAGSRRADDDVGATTRVGGSSSGSGSSGGSPTKHSDGPAAPVAAAVEGTAAAADPGPSRHSSPPPTQQTGPRKVGKLSLPVETVAVEGGGTTPQQTKKKSKWRITGECTSPDTAVVRPEDDPAGLFEDQTRESEPAARDPAIVSGASSTDRTEIPIVKRSSRKFFDQLNSTLADGPGGSPTRETGAAGLDLHAVDANGDGVDQISESTPAPREAGVVTGGTSERILAGKKASRSFFQQLESSTLQKLADVADGGGSNSGGGGGGSRSGSRSRRTSTESSAAATRPVVKATSGPVVKAATGKEKPVVTPGRSASRAYFEKIDQLATAQKDGASPPKLRRPLAKKWDVPATPAAATRGGGGGGGGGGSTRTRTATSPSHRPEGLSTTTARPVPPPANSSASGGGVTGGVVTSESESGGRAVGGSPDRQKLNIGSEVGSPSKSKSRAHKKRSAREAQELEVVLLRERLAAVEYEKEAQAVALTAKLAAAEAMLYAVESGDPSAAAPQILRSVPITSAFAREKARLSEIVRNRVSATKTLLGQNAAGGGAEAGGGGGLFAPYSGPYYSDLQPWTFVDGTGAVGRLHGTADPAYQPPPHIRKETVRAPADIVGPAVVSHDGSWRRALRSDQYAPIRKGA